MGKQKAENRNFYRSPAFHFRFLLATFQISAFRKMFSKFPKVRWLLRLLWLLPTLALLAWWRAPQLLTVDSVDKHGDALVLLGGDAAERTWRTLELFKTGHYELIVVSGDQEDAPMSRRLIMAGVPEEKVLVENHSQTTRQNAEFTIPLLRASGVKRAVIVTSWYHTRRALATFRQAAGDIEFVAAPAFSGANTQGRAALDNFFMVAREYLKLGYYALRYGVNPL